MLGFFAFVAAAIAAVGIGGVMAYSVSQSTREIGIRMAIGAKPGEILALVLRQGVAVSILGIVLGLFGAATVTRYLREMLFGLEPLDPLTFFTVSIAFAVVATVSSYFPAGRPG